MSRFYTRAQMRALDRAAEQELGLAGVVLMENAGRGAAEVIRAQGPGRVAIVCGPGNNGGDGFVVARHLAIHGVRCDVFLVADRARVSGDARTNLEAYERGGGVIREAAGGLGPWEVELGRADRIVDALFGTGLDRPLAGVHVETLERLSRLPVRKVALDLPSGLDADTGQLLGPALAVECTVTFAGHKRGLLLHPGAALAGTIHVVSIGTPSSLASSIGWDGVLLDPDEVRPLLARRAPTAHKGTAGHLLLVAGSPGRTGAALLAGEAAMRSGAGLVTIAARPGAREALDQKVHEVMTAALTAGTAFSSLAADKDAFAVGPGLGTDATARQALVDVLGTDRPVVLDADALTLLSREPGILSPRSSPVVLTPHPGEMARLTGLGVAEVQADRVGVARATARRFGAVVVLKGAHTVISAPDGELAIAPFDNPGLGSAGTGDVLCGVIGALLAGGAPPAAAAWLGVTVHGLAGEAARRTIGERGMIARDVIAAIPGAIASIGAL